MGVLRQILLMALGILLPLALQHYDRRRFDAEQRARAWNGASWGAALYAFGPLSMLGWCWVTRPRWPGWQRLVVGALSVLAIGIVIQGVDWLLPGGDPEPEPAPKHQPRPRSRSNRGVDRGE